MPEPTGITNEMLCAKKEEVSHGLRMMRKAYAVRPVQGERFSVPRADKQDVDTILYRPKDHSVGNMPVLFNMHGGGWLGGDAVLMESFCQLMADELDALVVNVNYKKLDEKLFPYPQEEICDTIHFFADHADYFGIDPTKILVGGHSAGAHLAACAAWMLAQEGFLLAGQMLVYPCVDLSIEEDTIRTVRSMFLRGMDVKNPKLSPYFAEDTTLNAVAPAVIVVCGQDTLRQEGVKYACKLTNAGVSVSVREWKNAQHGFLEVNRPDYPAGDSRQTPEQETYARECECYLIMQLRALLKQN